MSTTKNTSTEGHAYIHFGIVQLRSDQIYIKTRGSSSSPGFTYILTGIESVTPRPQPILLLNLTVCTVAGISNAGFITRVRVPSTAATNRSQQFEAEAFRRATASSDCTRTQTTTHHSAANELVGRFRSLLKAAASGHSILNQVCKTFR